MTDRRDDTEPKQMSQVLAQGGRDKQEGALTVRGTPRVRWKRVYDPELAIEVCERIAEGETLADICKGEGMPTVGTFLYWVTQIPALSQTYRLAREISGHVLEDEGLGIARTLKEGGWGKDDGTKVRALDVALDQLRWAAGFRNPKEFSPKSPVTFQVPIQINTSLGLADGEGNLPEGEKEGMEIGTDTFKVEVKGTVPAVVEGTVEPVPEDLVKEVMGAQLEPDKRFKRKLAPRMDREDYKKARWQRITTGRGRKILRRIRTDRPSDKEKWENEKAGMEAAEGAVPSGVVDGRGERGGVGGPGRPPADAGSQPVERVAGEGDARGDHPVGQPVGPLSRPMEPSGGQHHDPEGLDHPGSDDGQGES